MTPLLAATLAASLLCVAAAAADGPLDPQQRDKARAALAAIRDLPDATDQQTSSERRAEALDAAFRALSGLARSVTEPVASDGSLEAELVLVGQDLARDDSAVRRLRTKLQTPPEQLVDTREVPSYRHPDTTRKALLKYAFAVTWDEVAQLDANERTEARLSWEAAMLMPEMVGDSPNDARSGREIAFDVLMKLGDPAAIPVIVKRMTLDLERFGLSASLPVHAQAACIGVARLAISDGTVSPRDIAHLLEVIRYAEASADNDAHVTQLINSLVREFRGGRFTPVRAPIMEDGVAIAFERPTRDEHIAFFQEWTNALDAYPRERLSETQRRLIDAILETAKTRLSD